MCCELCWLGDDPGGESCDDVDLCDGAGDACADRGCTGEGWRGGRLGPGDGLGVSRLCGPGDGAGLTR